jgi:hypothetical protein
LNKRFYVKYGHAIDNSMPIMFTIACLVLMSSSFMFSFSKPSIIENTAVDILRNHPNGLLSTELVKMIKEKEPTKLTGKNPIKSFYSIIYRREKKREILKLSTLFIIKQENKQLLYKLNEESK